MYKVIFVLIIILFMLSPFCFAAFNQTDSLTITTYYPAPHGYYRGLQAMKFSLGDTNGDGNMNIADLPTRSGDLRFKPQPDDPSSWPVGGKGQLSYSASNDAFYYSNGNAWVPQAGSGGGVCYTVFGIDTCASGYQQVVSGYTKGYILFDFAASYGFAYSTGNIVCSPTKADSIVGHYFRAVTAEGKYSSVNNEPCAICCK